jgi:DNA-binding transcriptional MerR regulator
MALRLATKRAIEPASIPDRLYFKIGDVASICGVEAYVLRFWESQFPQLKPNKSGTGQRLYRRRDVETALEIKRLVYAEGYTLAGARQFMEQPRSRREPQPTLPLAGAEQNQRIDQVAAAIGRARAELRELANMLASPDPQPVRRRSRLARMRPQEDSLFPD